MVFGALLEVVGKVVGSSNEVDGERRRRGYEREWEYEGDETR